jgi:hypothetical protein
MSIGEIFGSLLVKAHDAAALVCFQEVKGSSPVLD